MSKMSRLNLIAVIWSAFFSGWNLLGLLTRDLPWLYGTCLVVTVAGCVVSVANLRTSIRLETS